MKEIQGLENYSYEEIISIIERFIKDRLLENNILEYECEIVEIQLHGSRLRGQAKKRSDLDAVLQYKGNIREDDMFNILNSNPRLKIEGIKVDINPIKEDMTSYMRRSNDYDKKKLGIERKGLILKRVNLK